MAEREAQVLERLFDVSDRVSVNSSAVMVRPPGHGKREAKRG